jgi:nitroreductase
MRHLAIAFTALVSTLPALAAETPATLAQAVLRDGCAQSYASYLYYYPPGSQAPVFSGERYKGDNRYYNDAKPCDDEQYAAYLEKADPATVMAAYPTAAGRPKVKKAPAGKAMTAQAPAAKPK